MREELTARPCLWDNPHFQCDVPGCEAEAIFYAVRREFVRLRGCAQHYAPVVLLAARDHQLYLRELMGDQFEYLRVPADVLAQWTRAATRITAEN